MVVKLLFHASFPNNAESGMMGKIANDRRRDKTMGEPGHLWDHYVYTSGINPNTHYEFSSWEQLVEDTGLYSLDNDLNILCKWEWKRAERSDYILDWEDIPKDEKEKMEQEWEEASSADILLLIFIQPNRAKYVSYMARVTSDDEEAVRAFLASKWNYLKDIWGPISS